MKRLFTTILLCCICTLAGLCGINKTLNEAQSLYQNASTIAQYQTAKKKFQSAKYDVGYVAAEHDNAINEGVRKCDRKINELSPRLTVNGNSSSTNISFGASGGSQTLSISTNQGTPSASALPSWITVSNISSSSISVRCSSNPNTTSRSDWFNVSAGNKTVRVNVSQSATENRNIQFTGSSFCNTTKDNTVIDSYGATLYASAVKYLNWRISYNGPSSSLTKTCYIKYIKPDGELMTGQSSPSGYTTSKEITFSPGGNTVVASGWGNDNATAYVAGTYRCELWFDGSKQYSATITLQRKAGESSYLKVDNKTSVSASFGASRSSETFYVSTDADSWTTWGVPSWCTITDKTSTSFKIVCEANTSSSSRSDYMKIKAGDKEVRIDITQSGQPRRVSIDRIWVDHNVFFGLAKGMKIHAKINVVGYNGSKLNLYCYFYYGDNTTPLKTQYGGQVQVSGTGNVTYDDAVFEDYTFNMPYGSLNMGPGWSGTLSFDLVIKDSSGNVLARKDNNTFTYSQGY